MIFGRFGRTDATDQKKTGRLSGRNKYPTKSSPGFCVPHKGAGHGEKRLQGKFMVRYLITGLFLLVPLIVQHFSTGAAYADISIQVISGYDDNVSMTSDKKGSGFASYRIRLARDFFSACPSADANVFVDGTYHDYLRVGNNYQLRTGASLNFSLADGRILPGIISEASVYRDDFLEEDDRNEISAGGQIDWLASARLTLTARYTMTWSDYRNELVFYGEYADNSSDQSGHHGAGGQHHGAGGQRQYAMAGTQSEEAYRDDRFDSGVLQATAYLTPVLQASMSAEHNRRHSSVGTESYRQNCLSLSLLWSIGGSWELSAMSFWKRADYHDTPAGMYRKDTRYGVGLGISFFIKNAELFLNAEWTENDSALDSESYFRTVTQCGFMWAF
ncbi:MAG: hypothetical protein B6245_01145 [Desulfobacteraceae bacterium 4572_88]|nr:MAG: hypothetical protein B6245_01145 [Desulfobacteraceae bacterium 4572_88]